MTPARCTAPPQAPFPPRPSTSPPITKITRAPTTRTASILAAPRGTPGVQEANPRDGKSTAAEMIEMIEAEDAKRPSPIPHAVHPDWDQDAWEREDADIVGAWVEETGKSLTTEPQGDPLQVAKNVYWKYKEAIKSSPILGEPEYIREDEEAKAKAAMWLAQSEKSDTEEVEVVHRKKNKRVTAKEMISRLEKTERRRHEGYLDAEQELLMEEKSDVSGSDVMRAMRSVDSTVWVVVSGVCATGRFSSRASRATGRASSTPARTSGTTRTLTTNADRCSAENGVFY